MGPLWGALQRPRLWVHQHEVGPLCACVCVFVRVCGGGLGARILAWFFGRTGTFQQRRCMATTGPGAEQQRAEPLVAVVAAADAALCPTSPPLRARRLVHGKEKGAAIEVDGERVQLGIPQVRGQTACDNVWQEAATPRQPAWLSSMLASRVSFSHSVRLVARHPAHLPPRGFRTAHPPARCLPGPQADGVAAAMKQLIALGRVGAPEEAAGAMLMLASPYASYITGQAVEVTGGGWL